MRKTVGECKDIKNDFYANDPPNDDLEHLREYSIFSSQNM
jgi:hypothetical protein